MSKSEDKQPVKPIQQLNTNALRLCDELEGVTREIIGIKVKEKTRFSSLSIALRKLTGFRKLYT